MAQEMQVRRHHAWSARSAYYLARTLTQQLKSGDDYLSLKPVIGIHLLDFDLFETPQQSRQALWCFELRDRQQTDLKLGDELQLNLIELPKADRLGVAQKDLAAWVSFFEHWQEEHKMAEIAYPPVKQAMDLIRDLSADAETRRLAFVRERAQFDEATERRGEREMGRVEGRAEGRAEGEARLFTRLVERRFGPLPPALAARVQRASEAELESWSDAILTAPTLDAVFAPQG